MKGRSMARCHWYLPPLSFMYHLPFVPYSLIGSRVAAFSYTTLRAACTRGSHWAADRSWTNRLKILSHASCVVVKGILLSMLDENER